MSRHGHKYSKYKKYLIMIMLICTKERLCNIFESQVMKKLRNTEAELRKALLMKKKACTRKVSKCEVFSSPYFHLFGPEKTPYLDIFHTVKN